jgi:hypothetical protein
MTMAMWPMTMWVGRALVLVGLVAADRLLASMARSVLRCPAVP